MQSSSGVLSTREQITEQLREDVLSGRLTSDERGSEVTLADRFSVSRGPIREATEQFGRNVLLPIAGRSRCVDRLRDFFVNGPPSNLSVRKIAM